MRDWLRRIRAWSAGVAHAVLGPETTDTLKRWLKALAEAGTAGYGPEVKRRLMILNMMAYLIAVSTLIYALQHTLLDYATYKPVVWINLALVLTALAVPFSHRLNEVAGALIIVTSEWIALIMFAHYLGRDAGVQLQYIVGAGAAFVVFGLERWRLIVPIILSALALHLASWFWYEESRAVIRAAPEVINSIYTQAAITTFGLIAASVYYAFRLVEAAKAETEALLRNILPDQIVERLKARPNDAISDSFSEAAILFADISGFVALARRLGAARTVELLNAIVTKFDALSARHGVEKIKTIGDAYMVASGVPEPRADFLERLVAMAVDMQEALAETRAEQEIDIAMRIGIATGPVMAGVIGRQKFTYDVWGDAVNLAARLETLSSPGRILVCPSSKARLQVAYTFESRGLVDIKGVGQQETWFLLGARETSVSAAAE